MNTLLVCMEAEKFLKPEEFTKLLKAAKDDREKSILLLLAGAGLRVGEMVAVKAGDIDFKKSYLHIRLANAKLKKARTVVILPPVIEVLQKYLAGRSIGHRLRDFRKYTTREFCNLRFIVVAVF